ncbi:sugar ABC transporter substrate-binding protein [Deinococcus sp. Arct2-2]|uniref:ABC transporter substrate-binding protein n=1 Tax=Deinococcus sp. Arct2-2 TaxID=2568653 RepID=UPI0010A4FBA0|nr:sugar ABC transporter substrate-binding protein [Deinococcus sp. Arct2-2]THF66741.1 sugar ABC transporter substrate-binding protein [Deinococcus sp. Arct2-2]
MRRSTCFMLTALLGSSTLFAVAQNNLTLTHWWHVYGADGQKDAVYRYDAEYAKANNLKIEVSWIPGDYTSKLRAALAAGTAPDIFEYPAGTLEDFADGQLANLDDLFTPALKRDFSPTALQQMTRNGRIQAVKMHSDVAVVFYRKSLLKAAGLQPPKTFAELLAASKKLTQGNRKGLFVGNNGVGPLDQIMPWSAGVTFMQGNKITYNTPRTVKALQSLRELKNSGSLLVGAPADWYEINPFLQGQVAMQLCGAWAIGRAREALGDDFGIVPWPALDAQGKPATWDGGFVMMVNAKSKNLAAAKAYIKKVWLDSTAVPVDWNTKYEFHVPPRKSVATAANFDPSGPEAAAANVLNRYARQNPAAFAGSVADAYYNMVGKAVNGTGDIAALVKAAAAQSQQELARP